MGTNLMPMMSGLKMFKTLCVPQVQNMGDVAINAPTVEEEEAACKRVDAHTSKLVPSRLVCMTGCLDKDVGSLCGPSGH